MFEAHRMAWALALALLNAGNSIAASMAMIAITTRSSINVKAHRLLDLNAAVRALLRTALSALEGGTVIMAIIVSAPAKMA